MLVDNNNRVFENPNTGRFNGTIIDIVDLGKQKNSYGEEKVRLRVIWVLDAADSEGQPFRVMKTVNAVVTDQPKKSNLYEIAESVLGTAPSVPFDTDTLIGRSNELTIKREEDPKTKKVYANIKAIMPLPQGVVGPAIPTGFVRDEVRKAQAAKTDVRSAAPLVQAANTVATTATAGGQAPASQAPDAAF